IKIFLEYKKIPIKLSDFIIEINNDKIEVKFSKKSSVNEFNEIKNEIKNFLKWFSISNLNIEVIFTPEALGVNKLIKEIFKVKSTVYNKTKILDETIRPRHKPIDFEINDLQKNVYFEGFVFKYKERKSKIGTIIHSFSLGNQDKAVPVVIFDKQQIGLEIKKNDSIRMYGIYEFDEFNKVNILKGFNVNSIQIISNNSILKIESDDTEYKRNEFHVHTKMSTLDGIAEVRDYIEYAKAYNLNSITITDHNSVQSFPDVYAASLETDIKFNYGAEFDIYDDVNTKIVINERDQNLVDAEYVFFDLETTSVSAYLGEIIEFGAVKYKNNKITDRKQIFINPEKEISEFTTSLTSITNEDVKNSPKIHEVITEIKDWIGDAILVAHNASFDYNFLNKAYLENGLEEIKNPIIDTMKISWIIHPRSRSHRLETISKHEFVEYNSESSHRADYDAEVLSKIFERFLHKLLSEKNIRTLKELNGKNSKLINFFFRKHITMISKNQQGLTDLNKFVSWSNVKYFNSKKKTPSLPLSLFFERKLFDNVIIGSSCSNSLLFDSIMNNDEKLLDCIIPIYDYLEVFPPTSYRHLIVNNIISLIDLKKIIKKIIKIGEKYNIPVIASSNAHYAGKIDKKFRDVIISAQRVGGLYHPLYNFKNPKSEKPDAHLRSTSEMFEEFKTFLDIDIIKKIVLKNPEKIQSLIKSQKPIKDKLYPPTILKSEEKLLKTINNNFKNLYGDNPHFSIKTRLEKELNSIVKHGFSIIYYLSSIAVKKSLDDGYLVGSRGSVGSSIVATLSGITEVNPLSPHYRCKKCKHHEFNDSVDCGYDLPDKQCPVCNELMIGDGHSIPFETFLGFNADKIPDIDLNFSRDNQSSIHQFMKNTLGEKNIFRAGTISTAAFKTSIGYVKKYEEKIGINFSKATVEWIASKIEGGKRTTGQHPGGLIVIPDDMDVNEFTPINYPGDDLAAEWKTTHFDFHSIHNNLLKLDFLGHLDPSTIRMLQNLTKIDPLTIPMNDKKIISLFESNKILNYEIDYTGEKLGIIGLPEFGTPFVRELVKQAKPKSFSDLVRVSGLSHGTDVWAGNSQKLIEDGTAVLSEVISVRDDIMIYLIQSGIENSIAFNIMESVRKGNGLTQEWEEIMKKQNIPDWYIDSCKLIKYMFPKAHATAYVMMAYRIAWYKINFPLEYYATFFSKRDVELDLKRILNGIPDMKKHIEEINSLPKFERTKKHDDFIDTYNIIFEMYSRGIEFVNIDINKSGSINYIIDYENNKIIPPFSIMEGVGISVSKTTTTNRKKNNFISILDFKKRSGLPPKVIDALEKNGVFDKVVKYKKSINQLSLFE
ncbi:MAG: PolC-type DNA polymerase III, partial [Mycoplasmataceae bacterium]|nr:PolC-type DNA polymerase III [Mycoplasmataceae bacterium]